MLAAVVIVIPEDNNMRPYVKAIEMAYGKGTCNSSDAIRQWVSFDAALIDAAGTNTISVSIQPQSKGDAEKILILLLSGIILSQLHRHLREIWIIVADEDIGLYLDISLDDILLAPTQVTIDGETISLSVAQRAEWLLSRSNGARWKLRKPRDRREEYVRGLFHAARAAVAMTDASKETGHSDAVDVHGAVLEPTQETIGEKKPGDEEDAGVDE